MKNVPNSQVLVSVTIANGTPYSDAVNNMRVGARGIAVCIDGSWTAARLALQVADYNPTNAAVTWRYLRDDEGNLVVISGIPTSSNASVFSFPGEAWQVAAWPYFRLVSINTASEVVANQGAERTLKVSMVY